MQHHRVGVFELVADHLGDGPPVVLGGVRAVQRLGLRLAELDSSLADPQVLGDIARWRSLSREQAEVAQVVQQYRRFEPR